MAMSLGIGIGLPFGGAAAAALSYEGLIATRCRTFSTAPGGANRQSMSRTAHVAAAAISSLKIAFANFRLSTGSASEQTGGGSLTLTASVEYNGAVTQITFNTGSASATVADGDIVFSDYTAGNLGIPEGATFFIRTYCVFATSLVYCNWRNSALGDEMRVAASGLSDQTMSTGSLTGGTSTNTTTPPFAIISTTTKPSVILIGDSITYGQGDTAESATAASAGIRGSIAKSFSGVSTTLPFLNISTGGLQAANWPTLCTKRDDVLPFASHYVVALGRNDISVAVASANTTRTSVEAIITAILAANPSAKITVTTLTPSSTSTSGDWTSAADQTTTSRNGERVTYNGYVRAGTISGANNGYFEIADQVENSRDDGLWKSDGTADKYTADGIHPTAAGYDLIVSSGAVNPTTQFVYP
jgi:lysophospholipase L1-like esterase